MVWKVSEGLYFSALTYKSYFMTLQAPFSHYFSHRSTNILGCLNMFEHPKMFLKQEQTTCKFRQLVAKICTLFLFSHRDSLVLKSCWIISEQVCAERRQTFFQLNKNIKILKCWCIRQFNFIPHAPSMAKHLGSCAYFYWEQHIKSITRLAYKVNVVRLLKLLSYACMKTWVWIVLLLIWTLWKFK